MTSVPLPLPAHIDLEQFIVDEAHDLRAPFNQIIGFSKLLMNEQNVDYPVDLQQEDVRTIYRNGQRALQLMNGLIDVARLNRHEREVNPAEVDVSDVLAQGVGLWRKFNPAATLQVTSQLATAAAHITTDELCLRQVVSSLITLTVQYIDAPGTVTLLVEDEAGGLAFTVRSSGQKAEPFSRLDVQLHGYLARALIELQQGEINLAEETDDGAALRFVIPQR